MIRSLDVPTQFKSEQKTDKKRMKQTIIHLLFSSANLAGFFPIKACGLVGFTGFLPASIG